MSDYFLDKARRGRLAVKKKSMKDGGYKGIADLARSIAANGDRDLHNDLKKIAYAKGIPLYVFLDIQLKRVVEENKEYLK